MTRTAKPVLELKPEPDGMGYLYGRLLLPDGDSRRVDVLPPRPSWRGQNEPSGLDPKQWIIYVDGEEIARVERCEEIAQLAFDQLLPKP